MAALLLDSRDGWSRSDPYRFGLSISASRSYSGNVSATKPVRSFLMSSSVELWGRFQSFLWLAKINRAEVKLVSADLFGPVESGSVTMTGRLGVFPIQGKEKEPSTGTRTILPTFREGEIWWDIIELESRFGHSGKTRLWRHRSYDSDTMHPLDVFILPVRVMREETDKFYYDIPTLKGLMLLPTGRKRGEFRCVGLFEVSTHVSALKEFSRMKVFMARTEICNERFYESKDDQCNFRITVV